MSQQTQASEQSLATSEQTSEFASLLLQEFKPKTERAREAVETAVRTLAEHALSKTCLLYTSPSPRDLSTSRMPSSA